MKRDRCFLVKNVRICKTKADLNVPVGNFLTITVDGRFMKFFSANIIYFWSLTAQAYLVEFGRLTVSMF